MKRWKLLLAAAVAVFSAPLWAAAPAESVAHVDTTQAQAVIQASAECSRRQDWPCLARLMDPAALKDLRTLLGEVVEGGGADPRMAAMFGGKTPEQITRLDDAEFFAAFLGGTMRAAGGVTIDSVQVVGGIPEGDDQYHAITRSVMRTGLVDTPMTVMDIASVRRVDGQWRLQLKGDMRAMVEGLRRMRTGRAVVPAEPAKGAAAGDSLRPQLDAIRQQSLKAQAEAKARRDAAGLGQDPTETERGAAGD